MVSIRLEAAPAAILNIADYAIENALICLTKKREILLFPSGIVNIEEGIFIFPVSPAFASQNDEFVINLSHLHDLEIWTHHLRAASGRNINSIQAALIFFPVLKRAPDHIHIAADYFEAVNG